MRIAHVITRLILGGAQENTVLTCEDLMRTHGDEVLLVTGPPLGPEGGLLDRVRREGVPIAVLTDLRRAVHPLRDARSWRAIKHTLREFQPQVVHTHGAKGGVLGRLVASALHVPAIVHTVHGAPFHPYQSRGAQTASRWIERYAAGRCDAMVSVADAMTNLMVAAGVAPRDKFVTIYSGMEVEPFLAADQHRQRVRQQLGYDDSHVVIGKIARLFYLKGHEYLVPRAGRVVEARPNVRFLLVGDGILAAQIREQIRAAGLERYFHFTGLVPPDEIPGLIGAMDVVVHTSLREGLARVLPQALIAGKPVVSYDIDGAREVVIDGQTGFFVAPTRVDELADSLCALASDPALRDKFGTEGRARFTDQFRHETMSSQLRQLYERILDEKRAH